MGDTYAGTASYVYVAGTGFFNEAVNFPATYALGNGSGYAYYSSTGNDTFVGSGAL